MIFFNNSTRFSTYRSNTFLGNYFSIFVCFESLKRYIYPPLKITEEKQAITAMYCLVPQSYAECIRQKRLQKILRRYHLNLDLNT